MFTRVSYFLILSFLYFPLTLEAGQPIEISPHEKEVSPTEDLMGEHGVLNRLLLIYDKIISIIETHQNVPLDVLIQAATLMKKFIEEYHEKNEEEYIFPLFEKRKLKSSLVRTLRIQHKRGRAVTSKILALATPSLMKQERIKKKVSVLLRSFVTMYRPHEAREDTELFPLVQTLLSEQEFKKLGDIFEDTEHDIFGSHGFESIVEQVEAMEKKLGIFELSQFTPL